VGGEPPGGVSASEHAPRTNAASAAATSATEWGRWERTPDVYPAPAVPTLPASVDYVAKQGDLQAFMRDVPLFKGLLRSELDRIALVMNPRQMTSGDVLCTEGEPGHEFFLIETGEAIVERGGQAVAKLSTGDYFGELALLDRGPRSATVRATSDGRLYVLNDQAFTAVLNEVPALAQKLLAALARWVRQQDAAARQLDRD
jgi:signal-transduction protein with cAMP-binding, CBS, and nucleotidyltransferase domain